MTATVRHVGVYGRVQRVGFRAFVEDAAEEHSVEGWVRNRRDGTVEAVFAGREEAVEAVIKACRTGPAGARVEAVDVEEGTGGLLELRRKNARFSMLPTA